MNKSISVSLVIPVYNNEKTAVSAIKECIAFLKAESKTYEVIIADDKSTDNSLQLLHKNFSNKKNISIISNNKNLGIAKNLKKLYKKAKLKHIVLFSVDGDWNPADIQKMIVKMRKTDADILIGKRKKHAYNVYRRCISFFYNFLPVLFFGVNTIDAGSIKIFKKSVYQHINPKSKSVFFEAEFIIKAKKQNYKVDSIPISFSRKRKVHEEAKLSLLISSIRDLIIFWFFP